MEESKAAWDEVGSLFSGLGLKLKEHYAQAASSGKAEEGAGGRSDAAAAEAMRDAIRKLGAAQRFVWLSFRLLPPAGWQLAIVSSSSSRRPAGGLVSSLSMLRLRYPFLHVS